jgi:hypothetical protein
MKKSKIEREKAVVGRMIELYCKNRLGMAEVSEEYKALETYAHKRLDMCKFGNNKPNCKKCPIHCYKPEMREKVREIMRWAGPRMMIYDPVAAIRHLFNR